MSVRCIPLYTPLLCSKNGVCRGIPIFLIFAPKHRLWVHVISEYSEYPQSMFWSENKIIGIPLQTPVFLYKSGVQWGILFMGVYFS